MHFGTGSSFRTITRNCSRKEERKKKKKKRKAQEEDTSNQDTLGEPFNEKETEANLEQVEILEKNESLSRESQPESSLQCNGARSSQELTNSTESHEVEKIVESITTVSDNPKFINIFTTDSRITGSSDSSTGSYTKLKFEMKPTSKRNHLVNKAAQSSTFAELSNRLGPTVNLHSRKVGGNSVRSLGVEARERNIEGEEEVGFVQPGNSQEPSSRSAVAS